MNPEQREHKSLEAVNLGLAANVALAAVKTAAGILGGSPALLADGINSTSDVAYFIVVRVFMKLARKPADREHPYGHSQLESIAALVVGAFVVTTAVAIFWQAVNSVYGLLLGVEDFAGASIGALVVALMTVVLKIGLTVYTRRIGEQTNNAAVLALAHDHRNDVFSALAASLGIFLGRMGLPWVDPLAGALVALVILKTGIDIIRDSSADLMDTVPGQKISEQVTRSLMEIPEVKQVEEVRAHRFGPYLVMNVIIGVDGGLNVAEGDRIATKVERALYDQNQLLKRVYVHYHPARPVKTADAGVAPISSAGADS